MRVNTILLSAVSLALSVSAASIDVSGREPIEVDPRTTSVTSSTSYWCPSHDKTGQSKHDGKCDKPDASFKKPTFTCYFHNKPAQNAKHNDNDVHACTYDNINGLCKTPNNSKCPEKASVITKRSHEAGHVDESSKDSVKKDSVKQDNVKQDKAKDDVKHDNVQQDKAKDVKQDNSKQDNSKQDNSKQDNSKQDNSKQEKAKQDQTKKEKEHARL